ncbi:sensor histidine kinase [Siphonobacter aquaeclarae]|uniref:Histidine kinase n=1 Tax=Siphonobacter aquaeclarae TaxID=563176 RepID=A0A1G9PLI1_9BACT|nr:histidine kinase [Siphonobacter aquaeclarae]SDL99423.1 Histidine kinase [Siphonobacter aquaeclarae]
MANRLSSRQKWHLATSLAVIYSLTVLYTVLPGPVRDLHGVVKVLPFAAPFCLTTWLLFFFWLSASDWIQERLFRYFGENFLLEFSFPAQLAALGASLVLALAFNFALHTLVSFAMDIVFWCSPPQHNPPPRKSSEVWEFVARANNAFSVMIMLAAFYLIAAIRASQRMQEIRLRSERLEKESIQAQFVALKNQVNPHFLFNSLSILSSVVHVDAELSEKFIAQLSKSYRYILEQKDNELVSLKTELEFAESYTFLLKIRFGDKFDVRIDVPEDGRQAFRIAPLTLQLLIENAVKHNSMSAREPLEVTIRLEDRTLVVENSLRPRLQPETSTGIGLRNITERYRLLTDRDVRYGEKDGLFVVQIPLIV